MLYSNMAFLRNGCAKALNFRAGLKDPLRVRENLLGTELSHALLTKHTCSIFKQSLWEPSTRFLTQQWQFGSAYANAGINEAFRLALTVWKAQQWTPVSCSSA